MLPDLNMENRRVGRVGSAGIGAAACFGREDVEKTEVGFATAGLACQDAERRGGSVAGKRIRCSSCSASAQMKSPGNSWQKLNFSGDSVI
jgi:hypothetical protein